MKTKVLALMVVALLVGSAAGTLGGTYASFSDSETSLDNYLVTGAIDLKVNGRDDLGPGGAWGQGVGPVSQIGSGQICVSYPFTVSVWNAGGLVEGDCTKAYVHIKLTNDPDDLSQHLDVAISYDGELKHLGLMSDLACNELLLGDLPSPTCKEVAFELHAHGGSSGDRVDYDLEFILHDGCSFVDSEKSEGNYFQLGQQGQEGEEGTIGFWKNWDSHNTYTKTEIDGWLADIDTTSLWLNDADSDGDLDTDDLVTIITAGQGPDHKSKFLAHYIAQRLNLSSGRQNSAVAHDVASLSSYDPAVNYLGLADPHAASAAEIVSHIESKHYDIAGFWPADAQYEVMKDICDALNNLAI